MDKKKLSQLRPLKRELVLIDKRLDKLYERQENVQTGPGKGDRIQQRFSLHGSPDIGVDGRTERNG